MSLTLVAPLLPAPAVELDSALQAHLGVLVEEARRVCGGSLHAVVLGGSLARGEGAVLCGLEGFRLLSDIDLYLVVGGERSRLETESIRSAHEASNFAEVQLDLGIAESDWFRTLPPTLPAHQLRHGHRVLWSADQDFSLEIPSVDVDREDGVDRHDALKLMLNRFAEELLAPPDESDKPRTAYRRAKLHLDLPLAWLSARGMYHPSRDRQAERLTELAHSAEPGHREWWDRGLERHAMIRERIAAADASIPSSSDGPEQRRADLAWSWPFFRDALRVCLSCAGASPSRGIAAALDEDAPSESDTSLAKDWLRRLPALARVREARRWMPFAASPVRAWYRHGWGGVAPERIQMACALRFGGLDSWNSSLRGLLPERELNDLEEMTEVDRDRWLGRKWSDWVMGGSRS